VKLSTAACRCLMGWYRIEGLSNHNPIKHQATRILSQHSLHCLLIALWQAATLCDNTFCTCLKSRCSCYSSRFSGSKGLLENLKTTCIFSLLLQDSQGHNYIYIESVITHLADQPSYEEPPFGCQSYVQLYENDTHPIPLYSDPLVFHLLEALILFCKRNTHLMMHIWEPEQT
jgi:hypothetical protein